MRKEMRFGFTEAEKTDFWIRWQRGESQNAIGRVFGKGSASIYCELAHTGGIRPRPRRRSRLEFAPDSCKTLRICRNFPPTPLARWGMIARQIPAEYRRVGK